MEIILGQFYHLLKCKKNMIVFIFFLVLVVFLRAVEDMDFADDPVAGGTASFQTYAQTVDAYAFVPVKMDELRHVFGGGLFDFAPQRCIGGFRPADERLHGKLTGRRGLCADDLQDDLPDRRGIFRREDELRERGDLDAVIGRFDIVRKPPGTVSRSCPAADRRFVGCRKTTNAGNNADNATYLRNIINLRCNSG